MQTELCDGSMTIRSYRNADIPLLFQAASTSIAEIFPWLEWCHPGYSMNESASWVQSREAEWTGGTDYSFAICDPVDGTFLGGVGLNQLNRVHHFANLGYWVRRDYTRRGVATAAARLAASFGFTALGLQRIEIVTAVENLPSQRVAEKVEANREGILRNRLWLHGRAHDAVMYSLLPADRV